MPATHNIIPLPVNAVTAIAWRDRAVSAEVERDSLKVQLSAARDVNDFLHSEVDALRSERKSVMAAGILVGAAVVAAMAVIAWLLG